MGNASSSSHDLAPRRRPTSSVGGVGNDNDDGDDGSNDGGGGGRVFRLPLYRGERDAFLTIGDEEYDYDDVHSCAFSKGRSMPPPPPPLLAVEPKLSNNGVDYRLISPLGGSDRRAGGVVADNVATDGKGHGGVSSQQLPEGSSPPSVVSSSDSSSSYGTCHSTISSTISSLPRAVLRSADATGGAGGGIQSSWMRSDDDDDRDGDDDGRREQRPTRSFGNNNNNNNNNGSLLPVPMMSRPVPAERRRGGSSERRFETRGALDCFWRLGPTIPRPTMMRRRDSSASPISMFDSCMRSSSSRDEGNNKYVDEDEDSYYSCGYRRSGSSNGSQGSSQYSGYGTGSCGQSTHNSHHNHNHRLSNAASKSSLVSAFSNVTSDTNASRSHHDAAPMYTEEELIMSDGDEPTRDSDLNRVRDYHVVTTAALPWRTGTAVNPLLRAAHLLRRNGELRREEEERRRQREITAIGGSAQEDGSEGERLTTAAPHSRRRKWEGTQQKEALGNNASTESNEPPVPCSSPAPDADVRTDAPGSPCSLDYSCFSFSEIGTPNDCVVGSSDPRGRDLVSPLEEEEEEEDSLLLSPFTPPTIARDPHGQRHRAFRERGRVTLVLPWLRDGEDRRTLYGSRARRSNDDGAVEESAPMFANEREQEVYIRSWLSEEANMPVEAKELEIAFYPARYHKFYNSIFALGDICDSIPEDAADVCILEEPEHLNWYRAPGRSSWSTKFRHCIGVIHTNYKAYAQDHAPVGFLAAPLLAGVNSLVVQANCHRVVKLSGVLQEFAPVNRECVENVHGIRETFLKEGRRRRTSTASAERRAYFIGKLLWAKGFDQLLELETLFRFEIDIFGSGPDEHEIRRAFLDNGSEGEGGIFRSSFNKWSRSNSGGGSRQHCSPVTFLGPSDHSSLAGDAYSIFINPSLTEVLCTTTAEAIAMNKWAIVPSHPSNVFFMQFPNCLLYRNRREFASALKKAQNSDPPRLSEEQARLLSWEAATMRCVHAASITRRDAVREERISRTKKENAPSLKKTFSGLWSGGSKNDLEKMNVCPSVSSSSSSTSEAVSGYGNIGLVTP